MRENTHNNVTLHSKQKQETTFEIMPGISFLFLSEQQFMSLAIEISESNLRKFYRLFKGWAPLQGLISWAKSLTSNCLKLPAFWVPSLVTILTAASAPSAAP
jgi:hypothetical protein